MRIRLALSLDIRREPPQESSDRETELTTDHERAETRPPIGFRPSTLEPEEKP